MKNTRVEKIGYWSALVGQLGWSKNSHSYFKNILCCSLLNVTPHNKFHPNWMKNTEVKTIRYQTALVGLLGGPKNNCSHSKFILCCSLPNDAPHNKFHPNWIKNAKVRILKIINPQIFFEKSTKAKLLKLETFAWSHWIWNCLNYLQC